MWTHFFDMHSGGGLAEPPYHHILIEAKEEEARNIFINLFGHDPDNVSCQCCGADYAVYTAKTLDELIRGFRELEKTLVIHETDIKIEERNL